MDSKTLLGSTAAFARAACVLLASGTAFAASAQQAATLTYAYLGRVMDARRSAFDAERQATVSVANAEGRTLASSKTFFLPNSRRNYKVEVPMADTAVEGFAQVGDVLAVSVIDANNGTWAGMVIDRGRTEGTVAGEPGGAKEVDIILAEDKDGDGLDDALVNSARLKWIGEYGAYLDDFDPMTATFDINEDHDGDGMSTRDELLSGTEPLNAGSVLRITDFSVTGAGLQDGVPVQEATIVFPTTGGHAYTLLAADALDGEWKPVEFLTGPDASATVSVLSFASSASTTTQTVWLRPVKGSAKFFKVIAE